RRSLPHPGADTLHRPQGRGRARPRTRRLEGDPPRAPHLPRRPSVVFACRSLTWPSTSRRGEEGRHQGRGGGEPGAEDNGREEGRGGGGGREVAPGRADGRQVLAAVPAAGQRRPGRRQGPPGGRRAAGDGAEACRGDKEAAEADQHRAGGRQGWRGHQGLQGSWVIIIYIYLPI
ncbi:heat shock, partial [Musa troglodytarum]